MTTNHHDKNSQAKLQRLKNLRATGIWCVAAGFVGIVLGFAKAFETMKIHGSLGDIAYMGPGIFLLLVGLILIDEKKMKRFEQWLERRRRSDMTD